MKFKVEPHNFSFAKILNHVKKIKIELREEGDDQTVDD